MTGIRIPKRISTAVLNSLTAGVVPRVGREYITVGRKKEIDALLHDINNIEEGGASFRFVVGKYGSGKSFLLQLIRNYAMEKGFVVVDADLSPERRFVGNKGQGLATYKELMQNMSTKTKSDGGALSLILERWISGIQTLVVKEYSVSPEDINFSKLVEDKILDAVNEIEGMVNGFNFARVINLYWKAYNSGDDEKKSVVLRWLRGEYSTKSEAIRELGVNVIIGDDNWYEYLKLFSQFMVHAGYKGLIVIIDELVNLYKIPQSITRQSNYEKILTIFNDTMQGKAKNIGIILGGTPQFVEDTRKGIFSYEALKSRLEEGRFSNAGLRDMFSPIIRLETLTNEELFVLVQKLVEIHAMHYEYQTRIVQEDLMIFMQAEFGRMGTDEHITPREVIRDFVEILNILYQNTDVSIQSILGSGEFKFNKDTINDEKIHEEYAEFEL